MEPDTAFYRSQRFTALVLAIIPGFGQFYNRQFVKGALFFVLLVSFYGVSRDFIAHGMWGIRTLGKTFRKTIRSFYWRKG